MNDGFQLPARGGIGEYALAHRGAVEAAVGGQHVGAERRDHRCQPGRAGSDHGARDQVGVGDEHAQRLEAARDRALARSHAAGDADDEITHGLFRPVQSPVGAPHGRDRSCRKNIAPMLFISMGRSYERPE